MATIWADTDGKLIRFFVSEIEFTMNPEPPLNVATQIEFDISRNPELADSIRNQWNHFSVVGTDLLLDGVPVTINVPSLTEVKQNKIESIDNHTRELINNGFEYDGQFFSLSANAQINWTNLFIARSILPKPVQVSTKDDISYNLADETAIQNFYILALTTVKAFLTTGLVLKNSVIEATNIDEVNAIVDVR